MEIINTQHIDDAFYEVDRKVDREDWEEYTPDDAVKQVMEWLEDALEGAVRTGGVDID